MRIAILGTRGIPNHHGGFEQFAENFAVYLASKNHDVFVYNSHKHPFQGKSFNSVNIIHCFDPEYKLGTIGQFIYDFNCIIDSRKQNFDIILQLGYTSNSIWYALLPKKPIVMTNMDGLEWKRSKYTPKVRRFLKYAEKLAVKSSDYLIADSLEIKNYIKKEYGKNSKFIPYGASVFINTDDSVLKQYNLKKYQFSLIIARLEPENNIETIVDGYTKSKENHPLLIFGGLNKYGSTLKQKYNQDKRIRFVGSNYNQNELNNLRFFSKYYFHGHSVGGTNPSLLEAMASDAFIIANDNMFNKTILGKDAFYFTNSDDIKAILENSKITEKKDNFTLSNKDKIKQIYSWDEINSSYEEFMKEKITC